MDELSKVLRVLLKRMPYELFMKNELDCMAIDRDVLNKAVHAYMPSHSATEIQYMMESLADFQENYSEFLGHESSEKREVSVFEAIFRFADGMLVKMNNEVMCRYERILRWRMTTADISEEIFVLAFLARRDLEEGIYCKDFTWPTVIGHNNMQLRNLTRKGMAENHFHLWGSAPYFYLAWIQMMNDLRSLESRPEPDEMDSNLRTGYIVYDKRFPEKELRSCCLQAALIRLYLFSVVTDRPIKIGEYFADWQCLIPWTNRFQGSVSVKAWEEIIANEESCSGSWILKRIYEKCFQGQDSERKELERGLSVFERILKKKSQIRYKIFEGSNILLRDILKFLLREQGMVCLEDCKAILSPRQYIDLWQAVTYQKVVYYLNNYEAFIRHVDQIQDAMDSIMTDRYEQMADYALTGMKFAGYFMSELNYVLSGERRLIYEMFRRAEIKDKSLSPHIYNLFYSYLIIKQKVRSEMVQSNEWVGFDNFSAYQDRKDYFSAGRNIEKLKAKMAVFSCLEQNVKLLEIRITPGNTVLEDYHKIRFLEDAIDTEGTLKDKFFYVVHFIKRPDAARLDEKEYCPCRHEALRKICAKKAIALMDFRRDYPRTAGRVLGIDAASNEIGCRPEVFAQIFRTLKKDTCFGYAENKYIKLPQLRATYHVGEDFLDLADGLRAIDEAILFLNLDCGDRIGHGLALGISVYDWYKSKEQHISLPKQDYLDNLVWLYFAIIRYKIPNLDNLKNEIEKQFQKYFSEIYGSVVDVDYMNAILDALKKEKGDRETRKPVFVFDIHAYYNAWMLRGDAPELYKKGYYQRDKAYTAPMEVNAVNFEYPIDFAVRKKPEPAMLYYSYHYDVKVRREGQKKIDVKVSLDYVKGVELVQKAMQREIAARGIAIESNPSSNYLIGTFKRYEEHPIIKFFNNGLTKNYEELVACPQIWTSINTDDQGVFDIKLENEYALLARALEKKKNEKGEPLYQKSMIYEWLDKLRRMGISQSFGNVDDTSSIQYSSCEDDINTLNDSRRRNKQIVEDYIYGKRCM